MKRFLSVSAFILAPSLLCGSARSQSLPAEVGAAPSVGFQIPKIGGSLQYALHASELISTGFYNSGAAYATSFSGDLAYLSRSTVHPFSAIYSGGVLAENSGQPTSVFQSLDLSQVYTTKNWHFVAQDAVSFLPESPITGLSGIPGVGDLGIAPIPVGPETGVGILTNYGPRVSNTVTGSASRIITGRFSAQGSGSYSIQRFTGDNSNLGIDNSSEGGSAGLSYHYDPRSAITGSYSYSKFSYVGADFSFTTQGATIDWSRQWTRRFQTDMYVGPQHSVSSDTKLGHSSTEVAAGGSLSYASRFALYNANYSRGVNNGSGVLPGSFSDNISGGASRAFHREWSLAASVAYSRSVSLPAIDVYTFNSNTLAASGQVSRTFGRNFSGYGSYSFERQSTSGTAAVLNAFSGVYNTIGIGVSYSPQPKSFGK